MAMWEILLLTNLPILGGFLSGLHGGQIVGGTRKGYKNLAWCIPFGVCALAFLPWWTIIFIPLCYLKTTGHGRGFRIWEPMEEGAKLDGVERYGLKYLYGKTPLPLYKILIMAFSGLAAVSGGVIAFGIVNPWLGLVIAIGGLWKGINALIFDKNNLGREVMDGVCAYSGLMAACLLV